MSSEPSIESLARAIAENTSYDALALSLSSAQWQTMANYMQTVELAAGEVLIDRGALDRTLYIVERGAVSVHYATEGGEMRLAILNPGSVVGEGAFFSRLPRAANVVATGACRLWRLTPIRFNELAQRQPELALAFVLELGAVVAKRLVNRAKRTAVT